LQLRPSNPIAPGADNERPEHNAHARSTTLSKHDGAGPRQQYHCSWADPTNTDEETARPEGLYIVQSALT